MLIRLYIGFICYVPLLSIFLPRLSGVNIHTKWIVFYLLTFAFIVSFAMRSRITFLNKWILILGVYYAVVFASIAWSKYSYDVNTLKGLFVAAVVPFSIAIMAVDLFERKDNVDLYIKHVIAAAFILSLLSIYQMVSGRVGIDEELRSSATFDNANGLAIFLVLCLPCILHGIERHILHKKLLWLVTASVVGGVICTVSRKGIVTMVIVFFIYYLLKKQFKKIVILGMLCAFALVAFSGIAIVSHRFSSEKFASDIKGKKNMTYIGWQMFVEHPVIGLGYGGYYENVGKYFRLWKNKKFDAHNIFITALVNYGAVGFIPFMGIFLYPLILSLRAVRQADHDLGSKRSRDMAVICASCIISFMINGYFAGGLFYQSTLVSLLYTHCTFVLCGSAEGITTINKTNTERKRGEFDIC